MTGHLGTRVSALLDGQMSAVEADRAWAHVHQCHTCRDQVEREGWVKTRLAGLSLGRDSAPDQLKGSLLGMPPGDVLASFHGLSAAMPPEAAARNRRNVGLAALGGGAVGAAVMGVLAFGAAPADAPSVPVQPAQIQSPSPTLSPGPLLSRDTRP